MDEQSQIKKTIGGNFISLYHFVILGGLNFMFVTFVS